MATGTWEQALDDANQVHHLSLVQTILIDALLLSSGDHTGSVVTMWLRDETCSFTQGRGLRQCDQYSRRDALETSRFL